MLDYMVVSVLMLCGIYLNTHTLVHATVGVVVDLECDFETTAICGYTQATDDDNDWRRLAGSTPSSSTGPTNDHTLKTNAGHYMYIETSPPRLGEIARLVSPLYTPSTEACLLFHYHMFGSTINTLNVYLQPENAPLGAPSFTLQGDQGNAWQLGKIPIPAGTQPFNIVFEGVYSSSFTGDIAIDDIGIVLGPCPTGSGPCDPSPCINGGQCFPGIFTFTCSCPPGFSGICCEIEPNPCDSGPCLNGGTCIKTGPFIFTCTCTSSFTGTLCQTELNPCDSSPCLNGGTCIKTSPLTFTCTCPAAFVGTRCETERNPCDSGPCLNGGTCIKTSPFLFTCTCTSAFLGTFCQTERNPCDSGPCLNGGTCVKTSPFLFTCTCTSAFLGTVCQTERNPCDSGPCLNGGTCIKTSPFLFTCTCTSAFLGTVCQTERNPCDSGPCLNGGTCVKTSPFLFTCTCTSAFLGTVCQTERNPCDSGPCLNGGTCVKTSPFLFTCTCTSAFLGTVCQTERNPCDSGPCLNGGTCIKMSPFLFTCTCTSAFLGTVCQTERNPCASCPCLNGGICFKTSPFLFNCYCPKGFLGPICQTDLCCSGYEVVSGLCVPCPVGYYKDNNYNDINCKPCPPRHTTLHGATESKRSCKFIPCSGPLDLVIAVDVSTQIHQGLIRDWLNMFVGGFVYRHGSVRIGIIGFSNSLDCIIPLHKGRYKSVLRAGINRRLHPMPSHNISVTRALQETLYQIEANRRPHVPIAVLFINDNVSTNITATDADVITLIKNCGVHITVIGPSRAVTTAMASDGGSQFIIAGYENLPPTANVLESVCGDL